MAESFRLEKKMLDEKDIQFIRHRERLARWWNPVGYGMLAVFIGMVIWLFIRTPNFINPLHVIEQLRAGTLPQGTLVVMAGMLPIMVLGLFLVCCTVIGLVFVAFANEWRYLRIIKEKCLK